MIFIALVQALALIHATVNSKGEINDEHRRME